MNKSLTAAAVLGAFAGSVAAAQVQLYGILDTGFAYVHSDMDVTRDGLGVDATDSFSMESGMQSASRFGFKGTEELGNGLSVGFVLENQFSGDTGAVSDNDHFFRREASLFIQGGFGKLALGRMGSINSGVSSWGKHGAMSAFGTSWGGYAGNADNLFGNAGIWDNALAYETPSFAGFKVFAQYGMGNQVDDGKGGLTGVENESSSDRYYAIGASYDNGPLSLYLSVDSINYATFGTTVAPDKEVDDSLSVRFGGSYDFEVVKIYAGGAYFDEAKISMFSGAAGDWLGTYYPKYKGDPNSTIANVSKIKGWSLGVSGNFPLAGGNFLVGAGYLDANAADSVKISNPNWVDMELSRWVISAGYAYPLSKRTNVYGVVTYNRDSIDNAAAAKTSADPTVYGALVGLRHQF